MVSQGCSWYKALVVAALGSLCLYTLVRVDLQIAYPEKLSVADYSAALKGMTLFRSGDNSSDAQPCSPLPEQPLPVSLAPSAGLAQSGSSNASAHAPRRPLWDNPGMNYYPFDDMFFPYDEAARGPRSLVFFTASRSAMENIDALVRQWGTEHFDYVVLHFDDSSSEWQKFDWYRRSVGVTAVQQAKFWYYKRFAVPWLVKGYRFVHFSDSDTGSPPEQPFDLRKYEELLTEHKVMLGQPAVSLKGRSSDYPILRLVSGSVMRWVDMVENGPFYSVAQEAYECYWQALSPSHVSGWGTDAVWCQYLHEICGFPQNICAVVDAQYIDHLNLKTASGLTFRGQPYDHYGTGDLYAYVARMREAGGHVTSLLAGIRRRLLKL